MSSSEEEQIYSIALTMVPGIGHIGGIDKLYLVTDHTAFYERCGWSFLTMVQGDDGCQQRMYLFQT